MVTALYIALAGALGSLARYGAGAGLQRLAGTRFPYGTLLVNVVGSFLIGLVMAMFAARGQLDSRARLVITIGLLGGFTTYSSFALETVTLLERRSLGAAAGYVSVTLVTGALACWAGLRAGAAL
jgi:fluoride exporter